jgi:transcriptional regulator with XRE-family HTH domain
MAPAISAVSLAKRLRELRVREWPDVDLTQSDLARALSAQGRVASTTLSSWESLTNPKTPTTARLNAYALFFATRKSIEGEAHLVAIDDLDETELDRFHELKEELLALHASLQENDASEETRRALLYFEDAGPVVIICPEAPPEARGPLADETDVNHTRLHRYADIDALIELFGHIRALNPEMHVLHRLSTDVQQTELQNHLVLLGGIGWN